MTAKKFISTAEEAREGCKMVRTSQQSKDRERESRGVDRSERLVAYARGALVRVNPLHFPTQQ